MWEFGMDGGRYDAIEFRNRHITLPALDDDCVQPESLLSHSALQVNSLMMCIGQAHTMLECFLEVSTDKMRKAPNVIYVRAVYSLVTLMKAEYAVGTDEDMSELLESQSLKVGYYLDMVLKKTSEAMGPQKCRNPSHWNFVLEAKLKSWWDEYQEWRKEGRHLKRRKTKVEDKSATATGNQTPVFADPKAYGRASTFPQSTQQSQPTMPNFNMAVTYPSWNAGDLPIETATSTQTMGDPATFTPDMGDFSAAFQNGDLYLWNDVSADNFGSWVPQGAPYSGMGYGTMNGQGF